MSWLLGVIPFLIINSDFYFQLVCEGFLVSLPVSGILKGCSYLEMGEVPATKEEENPSYSNNKGKVPATKEEDNPSYSNSKGEDEVPTAKEEQQPSFSLRGNTVHLTPAAIKVIKS